MITQFQVQVLKDGGWCRVTTVKIDQKPSADDQREARQRAYREAVKQVVGWRGYFTKDPLRIVAADQFGRFVEVAGQ